MAFSTHITSVSYFKDNKTTKKKKTFKVQKLGVVTIFFFLCIYLIKNTVNSNIINVIYYCNFTVFCLNIL